MARRPVVIAPAAVGPAAAAPARCRGLRGRRARRRALLAAREQARRTRARPRRPAHRTQSCAAYRSPLRGHSAPGVAAAAKRREPLQSSAPCWRNRGSARDARVRRARSPPPIARSRQRRRRPRSPPCSALFAASGCAALIYQVVWFEQLSLAIGSSALSLGVLLATFMGGLGVGSLLASRGMRSRYVAAAPLRARRARDRRARAS